MWMPARLDRAAGADRVERDRHELAGGREHDRPVARAPAALGGVADPLRAELARRARGGARRASSPPPRSPSAAAPATRGAPTRRSRTARRARPAAPRPAAARGTRSPRRRGAARPRSRRARPGGCTAKSSGTTMTSAYPPSTVHPVNSAATHRFSSPRTQNAQTPHVRCNHGTPTRSPTARRVHPSPRVSTRPDHLMTGHHRQVRQLEIALDDVEIGAAAPARVHAHAHLAPAPARDRDVRRQRAVASRSGPRPRAAARRHQPTLCYGTTNVASPLIAAPPEA